nr:immunoglobulin light chain junction region [Macaca mulatta]
CQQYNSLSYSF